MSRQRNPEETKNKILKVAQKLFIEKGYDNTSIQDIIDGLDGMTKGAIYHHFKSKYDILDTILDDSSKEDMQSLNPGSTGLESIRNMMLMSLKSFNTQTMTYSAAVTLKSPRIIGEQYLSVIEIAKEIEKFMNQGIKDGSIKTKYPKEISEILLFYTNMIIGLHLVDLEREEFIRKLSFLKDMLGGLGVPIINNEIMETSENLYDYLHRK